jgi:hypothetical protein
VEMRRMREPAMKSHKRRTAEEVCIEYHLAAAEIRAISAKIEVWGCTSPDVVDPNKRIEPCVCRLFKIKPEWDLYGQNWNEAEEFESEMCDHCTEALRLIRERRALKARLGAAKRAVGAVGKRLNAEKTEKRG